MDKLYTFLEYKSMVDRDVKYDRISIDEFQLKLPALKHFYVAHLIANKFELDKLYNLLNESISTISDKILKESNAPLSKVMARTMAEEEELPKKINKSIKERKLIIEYLEKVEKIFSGISFDLRNTIELIRMEME